MFHRCFGIIRLCLGTGPPSRAGTLVVWLASVDCESAMTWHPIVNDQHGPPPHRILAALSVAPRQLVWALGTACDAKCVLRVACSSGTCWTARTTWWRAWMLRLPQAATTKGRGGGGASRLRWYITACGVLVCQALGQGCWERMGSGTAS
jgi:hypothetical protein